MIGSDGSWKASESPDTIVSDLIGSGARYVRAAGATKIGGGIPNAQVAPYFTTLINAGISLGAAIYPQNGGTVSDLVQTGAALKSSGYYGWIFVDNALQRPDLQQIIDGLQGVGWELIMTNESAWGTSNQVVNPPTGVWCHAKSFYLLSKQNPNPDYTGAAVLQPDMGFISYIHQNYAESYPVLKLEIPPEINIFAGLPVATQQELLTEWSQAQSTDGYFIIYPLFVGGPTEPNATYDSLTEGTYTTQTNLIKQQSTTQTSEFGGIAGTLALAILGSVGALSLLKAKKKT
jgi:hypothetical protein